MVTAVAEIITTSSSSNTTETIAMTVGIEAVIGITITITIVAEVVVVAGPTTTEVGVAKQGRAIPSLFQVCLCVRALHLRLFLKKKRSA